MLKNIHVFMIKILFTLALLYYFFLWLTQGVGGLLIPILAVTYIIWVAKDYYHLKKNNAWQEPFTLTRKHKDS